MSTSVLHTHLCCDCGKLRTCCQVGSKCDADEMAHKWSCCVCRRAHEPLDIVFSEWFDRIEAAHATR